MSKRVGIWLRTDQIECVIGCLKFLSGTIKKDCETGRGPYATLAADLSIQRITEVLGIFITRLEVKS